MPQEFRMPLAHLTNRVDWTHGADELRAEVARLTGVPVHELTDDADLLSVGIDSVTVMRISGLMRRAGVRVEYRDLMRSPTLGAWWTFLRDDRNGTTGDSGIDSGGTDDAHVVVDPAEPFPLAVMQHAYWVGRTRAQHLGDVAAHFYSEFDHDGGVEPDRLERAAGALIARHPMLRAAVDDDGMQRVAAQGPWAGLTVHDLRALGEDERERRLARTREDLTHRVMDIASGEVIDVRLSLLPGGRTRLHLDVDMIAADALSVRNLLADLAVLYREGPNALTSIEYNYGQYLADRNRVRSAARAQAREWWQTQLPELPAAPDLPLLAIEAPGDDVRVERRHHWLSPERAEVLRTRSQRAGLTPTGVLATVFAETLGAWSATDRFLLNLPVFDREPLHDEVDRLVGDFSSSVLLDVDLSERMSMTRRAHAITSRLREVLGYSAYTGVEVLRDLSRAAGGDRVLAPVVYTSALSLGELYSSEVRNCLGEPSWTISQGPQVWLDAQVTEFDGGILLNWDARASLFPPALLDTMFDAYVRVVDMLLDDRDAWDREAPAPVRRRDSSAVVVTPALPLHQRFFELADAEPGRTALLSAGAEITYGELSDRSRRVARVLQDNGIGRGDSVGITLPKGVDQVVATLGVLAAGATYVPSGVDLPVTRREQVYRTAGVRLVITDDRDGETAISMPDGVEAIHPAHARVADPVDRIVPVDPEDTMYVIFTSGSTGAPKGVEVPHRAVSATVDAVNEWFDIGPQDRTIALSALDFDLSAYDMFAFLGNGGSVVVVDEAQRRDAATWAELIRRWDVTIVSAVPALLDMLLIAANDSGLGSSLRVVMLGGDRVTVDLPDRLRRLAPGCRFAGLGGMTEAAIHATICEVDTVDPEWPSVPYGVPLPHVGCRVVDSHGRDRPDRVPGELWVTGAGLAHGYRHDPERTAEKFVHIDGTRWYRTGDLVRHRSDGTIEFLGRTDHQVKIRGHRIELGEVEAVMADHPTISAATAGVVEGAARQLAAAMIVDGIIDDEEIRDWLGARLPGYMVPRRLVRVTEFPITRNGKIDRAAVHALLVNGSRDGDPPGDTAEPEGPAEKTVADIWSVLLGVETVRRDDDFFALGGDSLLATRLIRRLRAEGAVGADLAQLFRTPTLADFADTLVLGSPESMPVIHPDPDHRHDPFELTDIQRAFWIGRSDTMELGGVGPHYYLEFDAADVDLDRLEAAWNRLIVRHEMLRAVVTPHGDQRILPEVPRFRIDRDDVRGLPEYTLHRLRETLSHRVFDVTQWPMFTVHAAIYTRDGRSRTRLYMGIDGTIADGRSIMVLFTELDRLYQNPRAELAPLQVSFRDYVTQFRPADRRLEQARRYWADRVRDLPPAPDLPLARSPRDIGRPRFQRLHHVVEPGMWRRITEQARTHRITPNVVLLSGYFHVLGAWASQHSLTVNVTMFDRADTDPDVTGVVGDFASLLLLGHEWSPDDGFAPAARRLQQQQGQDLAHREASGIWALRELARHRGASSAPMPVVFTSVLGVTDSAVSLQFSESFPEQVYGITQTPQVWLDNKVADSGDGISIDWEVVADLFPGDTAVAMFSEYVHLIEGLADADWSRPLPEISVVESVGAPDVGHDALSEAVPVPPQHPQGAAQQTCDETIHTHFQIGDLDTDEFSPIEAAVADVWQDLLGIAHVGRTDNFFDLGGDSIIATRLMSGLRAEGLAGAQLARLFTHPTLVEFAATITAQPSATAPVLRLATDTINRHEPFPLTDVQTAYWLGRSPHFDLGGIGASLYVEYEWPDLDVDRLERAWNTIVDRHAMLRAVVDPEGMQRVLEHPPAYRIPVIDAVGDFDDALAAVRAEMSKRVLDAEGGPLFGVCVVREHGRARVCAVLDSLIVDGLSALVIISEWVRCYADPADLPSPPGVEFRDYVTTCVPSADEMQSAMCYWRSRLAEIPPGPQLPLRVSPAAVDRPRFRRREARISSGTWCRIVERARGHGLTPSVVLLACYTWVLGQWSAERALSVTLTRFDRRDVHPDIMRVVGDFSSLMLVADQPEPGENWLARARRLQRRLWSDLDHQQVSAVQVLRELASSSATSAQPIPVVFTSMLGVDDKLARSVRWPDHTMTQTPQVWLDHQVIELPDGLLLSWDSVDELFPDGLIDAMLSAYHEVVSSLADADWEKPLLEVFWELPTGQKDIRQGVNDTAGPDPDRTRGEGLLHTPMFDVAEEDPERIAIIDGDTTVTFGELADRSRRIAALLGERGVRPGDTVAVSMARGAGLVAAMYGVLAAGAAYVPVATDQPTQRREAILRQAGVSLVLTEDSDRADDPDGTVTVPAVALTESDRHFPAAVHRGAITDLAFVIFTSGSTGRPKGVEIEHGSVVNTLDDLGQRFEIGSRDRVLAVAAPDFDLSVFDLFGVVGSGGSAVLIDDDDRRDAGTWLTLAHRHQVTVWNSVPAVLDMLVTVAENGAGLPSSLRLALVSGDWVGLDLPGRLTALSPDCRFMALGGATEASIWSNLFEVETVEPRWNSIPYGRPLRNQRFRVVDESGHDRPDWVPGELLIGGAGVARGYRGEPELTAAAFFADDDGTRWYRTGDLGRYWPDGTLEFLGRADRQVKVRGHRVELGEVEQAIVAHPGVRRAFAVAVGERTDRRLVVFAELDLPDGSEADHHDPALLMEELSTFLADRIPTAWSPELVPLTDPPLTGNGKIDHAALVRNAETLVKTVDPTAVEPIRPGLESQIAQVWAEVLGAAPVDRRTSFFGAGGDSLSATRLVGRLDRELGVAVSLREFFTTPTLAGITDARPETDNTSEEGVL